MSYRPTFRSSASARPLAQAIAIGLALAYGPSAMAASIVVNVDTDTSNAAECSLRDAIIAARDNLAVNGCSAGDANDTISFNLTLPASIVLASGLPTLGDAVSSPGQQLVVQGPGAANLEIVAGNAMNGLFANQNPPVLTVDALTMRAAGTPTAAIFVTGANLTVTNSTITGPFSVGVSQNGTGSLTVENCTVAGALSVGVQSGGVFGQLTSPVVIRGSTFTGNALAFQASPFLAPGTMAVTIENSTFHANTGIQQPAADVRAFGYGGTLTLNLRNTTLSGDTASRRVMLETSQFSGGTVNALVDSSLFTGPVGSTDIDVPPPIIPKGAAGAKGNQSVITLTANNSIFSEAQVGIPETTPGTGNQFSVAAPGLGALANNGGPTQTLAVLAGSPAINTGSNPAALTTDQRGAGFPRIRGAATDVGAFEFTAPQNVQVFDPGNTLLIADADATPDVADGTDFGTATIGTPVVRTYTLRNTGDLPLAIASINSGSPAFVVSAVPASVPAGGTATFTVTFTPSASGLAGTTITLDSDDPDPADDPYTFAVQGTGQAPQNVQVFDASNTVQIADGDATPAAADGTDFGATPVGTPVARTYTLRNSGDVPLAITSIISGSAAFTVSGVPASVPALGTATFTVTYNAAAAGAANATITVASDDPDPADASYTFAVQGTGQAPQNVQVFDPGNTVQIVDGDATPAAADGTDFGATPVGTPVARTYTLRNTGNLPLAITSIISGSAAFTVSGVPASVPALGTATFTVTYNAAAAGAANATITVASDDPDPADASYTFAVTGSAFTVQNVQVFDPANTIQIVDGDATPSAADGTDFGSTITGTPVARTYTIRNTGTQSLTISSIISSSAAFTVSGVPASVAGGATATFTVTLTAGAVGPASGTITVASNDPDPADASYTFAVQGNVAGPRDIDVFDGSGVTPVVDGDNTPSVAEGTDFGSLTAGTSSGHTFMIRNSGGQPLVITSIVSSNPAFVVSGVPASVPAGGSITFTVTFNANAVGTSNGTLTITTDDPDAAEATYTFSLQGVAAGAGVAAPAVIPTLSGWAMMLLASVLAAFGWRRRESVRVKLRA